MVRLVRVFVVWTLFCTHAFAYAKSDVLLHDLSSQTTRVVAIIACLEIDIARTIYWEAVEGDEGGFYTRFLQGHLTSCQYLNAYVDRSFYRMCNFSITETCGGIRFVLISGEIRYGVLLPTFSLD